MSYKIFTWLALLIAVVTFATWVTTAYRDFETNREEALHGRLILEAQHAQAEAASLQLASAQKQLNDLREAVERASHLPNTVQQSSDLSKFRVQLGTLQSDTADLKTQISDLRKSSDKLYGLFSGDADRALSVPLLRKDFEGFKTTTEHDIDSVKSDIAKTYDINKWLIGLIAAGLLTTVINNLLQGRRERPTSNVRFE